MKYFNSFYEFFKHIHSSIEGAVFVSACKMGIFSKSVMLKICKIVYKLAEIFSRFFTI